MAWMDDVISQLMWQMQLQQMIGGGVDDPTRDPFDYRTTNDNRDIVIPSGAPRWEGYSGTKSNTNISGEMMHPNAGGVFPQPRPPPAGDVVLPATEGGGIPYMPRVLPGGEDRRSGELSQPSYSPGPYGSTRISDVRSDPVTQLMLQMQLQQMMGDGAMPGQGGYDPFRSDLPQAVRDSINLQPSYAEGSVPDTPNPQLQKVLFAGEKGAANAPQGAGPDVPVEVARDLAASGAKAPEIFQQTGWYRGADGEWKWTLSDKGADLNPGTFASTPSKQGGTIKLRLDNPRKLPEILNHPTLYETYPQFKDTTVERMPAGESGYASYDSGSNKIYINDNNRSKKDILSSILHEVQHPIQDTEGFGRGGTPTQFLPADVLAGRRSPTKEDWHNAQQAYLALSGEVEAYQTQRQFETNNWSQLPTQMRGFAAPDKQLVQRPGSLLDIGKAYQLAPSAPADPVTQLMLQMQLRSMPDWEPPVPPPLPSQDVLYQDTSRGSPAQNARRDMEIVATPRPPSENIDELIRSGQPGIADPRMSISRSDLDNAQFNFAPGYLRRTAAGDGGDPVTQLMLQMQLQQLMGGGDNSQFMQRPPLIGDVPPASRPEAWFENPPWLQGYPPEPSAVTQGMSMQGPAPGPPGLSGSYSGHGSFLRDYFGPNSPLRGTYRHTVPF